MLRVAMLCLLPGAAMAETLVAARTIRAQQVLAAEDLRISDDAIAGALQQPEDAIGREARVTLYTGRPIHAGDLGPPAVVERNQLVPLGFRIGGLTITAQGRALARGGAGDVIRVLNLDSRTVVSGRIAPDGQILVGGSS